MLVPMNLADEFQNAVREISYTGDELINALRAAQALLESLPDDIDLEQKKRSDRRNRRLSGEVIDIPVLASESSEGHRDNEDEGCSERSCRIGVREETVRDTHAIAAEDERITSSQFSTCGFPPPAAAASASEEANDARAWQSIVTAPPADENSNLTASRRSLRDDSDFVSPTSLYSGDPLLRSEVFSLGGASGEPTRTHGRRRHRGTSLEARYKGVPTSREDHDAPHTSSTSRRIASSFSSAVDNEMRERVRQLELYDKSPDEWLCHLVCIGAKLFEEEIEAYFRDMAASLVYMAVRRKRVEQRCQYLRDSAAQETRGGVDAAALDAATRPSSCTFRGNCEMSTAVALKHGVAAPTIGEEVSAADNSDNDDEENDEEVLEGFYISREVKRSIRVGLPDNAFRLRDNINSFFFTCYVSAIIQNRVHVAHLKRVAMEIVRICCSVMTWPRYPVNLRTQWVHDREGQFQQFLGKWLGEANGHLVTLMAVPPKAPTTVRGRAGSQDEGSVDNSTTAESSLSAVNAGSILTDDDNSQHEGSDDGADEESFSVDPPNSVGVPLQTAFLGPKTHREDAVRMTYDFVRSPAPCGTPLARLVADTVPGKSVDTLLPCIQQPERRSFNDGFCRLAPSLSQKELDLITELMQLPLTEMLTVAEELKDNHDRRALRAAEKEMVRHWASPTYDPRGGELTVLINPTNAFRLQLSNPIIFSLAGVQCDMCCVTDRRVSFQAVLDSGVRSEVVLEYEGCIGYDVCVACSYYYYKSSEMRLLRAVHPNANVRAPFAFGRFSKVTVHTVRALACEESEGDMIVEVFMGVSPYGVMPIGWALPVDRLAELSAVCPTLDEATELTADLHASLPVPPQDWKQRCTVANISNFVMEADGRGHTAAAMDVAAVATRSALAAGMADEHLIDEADVCPICLQPLCSPLPLLRTLCGHRFHVECIGSHYHYKPAVVDGEVNENNGCPVCRCSEYMPPHTDADSMMRANVYRLMLRVPADEVAKGRDARAQEWGGGCAIAVGTILTDDGAYHNATNIAFCEAFYNVMPGFAFTRPATEEAKEMEPASPAVP
ncbi:hypothetical protein, unknown function [Leishmania tarentolae]|uniref:RING-type domain-containing protein n=1 Tax=Leishmania tarentolae TaxID=5689 RepID=A0A640KIL2_LEITA|nr:hypothetical protein, unknown function [Leishmania tarentolae]